MKDMVSDRTKVFIDTNIILDYLCDRTDNIPAYETLVEAALDNRIDLLIAAHSLTNIFYITRKRFSETERQHIIRSICGICKTRPISGESIEKAITSGYSSDLEDALQMLCAVESNCDYFVTRDQSLYVNCPVRTCLPDELIRELSL